MNCSEVKSETHAPLFWKSRALPLDIAIQKMWKNAQKAVEEHNRKAPGIYTPALCDFTKKQASPLTYTKAAASAQGPREIMEDAHFVKELPQGLLAGVLDGHGGIEVAHYVSEQLSSRFSEALIQAAGNVHCAFESLLHTIDEEVAANQQWLDKGATAVICFFEPSTHLIYTATIGDSEANIYRRMGHRLTSTPLSCVRDWGSEKDAKRAAEALGQPALATEWPKKRNSKTLRFPTPQIGFNVSRAIGDAALPLLIPKPGIISKPKITIQQLKAGDILILASDGLKDYVPEVDVIRILSEESEQNPADRLVTYARKVTRDNVTVVAVTL